MIMLYSLQKYLFQKKDKLINAKPASLMDIHQNSIYKI